MTYNILAPTTVLTLNSITLVIPISVCYDSEAHNAVASYS